MTTHGHIYLLFRLEKLKKKYTSEKHLHLSVVKYILKITFNGSQNLKRNDDKKLILADVFGLTFRLCLLED